MKRLWLRYASSMGLCRSMTASPGLCTRSPAAQPSRIRAQGLPAEHLGPSRSVSPRQRLDFRPQALSHLQISQLRQRCRELLIAQRRLPMLRERQQSSTLLIPNQTLRSSFRSQQSAQPAYEVARYTDQLTKPLPYTPQHTLHLHRRAHR